MSHLGVTVAQQIALLAHTSSIQALNQDSGKVQCEDKLVKKTFIN